MSPGILRIARLAGFNAFGEIQSDAGMQYRNLVNYLRLEGPPVESAWDSWVRGVDDTRTQRAAESMPLSPPQF